MNGTPETAITVEALTVKFNEVTALDEVSFSLPAGAYLAVSGPNGSGKSTLLQTLLGLVIPISGSVHLFGQTPQSRPEGVSYVPQAKTMDRRFPGTSLDLIVSGLRQCWPWKTSRAHREEAMDALKLVDAEKIADRKLPALSGGELQRVFLARAAAQKPRLILLDEPTTGVDVRGEEIVNRALDEWHAAGNMTIVMVTHDLAVASHHATHVLLLNRAAVAFGAPGKALTASNLQRAYGHMGHHYSLPLQEILRG